MTILRKKKKNKENMHFGRIVLQRHPIDRPRRSRQTYKIQEVHRELRQNLHDEEDGDCEQTGTTAGGSRETDRGTRGGRQTAEGCREEEQIARDETGGGRWGAEGDHAEHDWVREVFDA